MKKITILLALSILLLAACSNQLIPIDESVSSAKVTPFAKIASETQATGTLAEQSPAKAVSVTGTGVAAEDTSLTVDGQLPTGTVVVTATLSTDYTDAESIQMQLIIGILQLDGTDQAVTAAQAITLLPLLTSLKDISLDSANAQEEIDSLVTQAVSVLNAEQIQAIADMQITRETALSTMEQLGVTMGGPPTGSENAPPAGGMEQPPQGTPLAGGMGQPPQGQMPQGAPPTGGQPPDAEQMGTPRSDGMQRGSGLVPSELMDVLIEYLQQGTVTKSEGQSAPPNAAPPGAGMGSSSIEDGLASASGAYVLDGGIETFTDQSFTASNIDQSGVYVVNRGQLTLNNVTVTTSGDTSSDENSSFYGLNAALLATSGSTVDVFGGKITTTGRGANGAFAAGSGASVNLSNVTINTSGDGGHGVMATLGGAVTLTDVDITTTGAHSAPIATDRGGGSITATGGTLTTSGQDSPCYYSTGELTISDSTCNATGSETVVIEGANTVILTNSDLTSDVENKWGVMIYQSFSGDAEGSEGVFTMTGGSLAHTANDGPLFYVTNSTAHISLNEVKINAASGVLLKAEGNDRWGVSGSNGGTAIMAAANQSLTGDLIADSISSLNISLQDDSSLTGAINAENSAKSANLTLDASSVWNVTADSYLTCLTNPNGISGTTITNIIGNGFAVYYNASACPALAGQTYALSGGGKLQPVK